MYVFLRAKLKRNRKLNKVNFSSLVFDYWLSYC